MVLSDENITKFQTLYKERFGIELSKQDAYEKGIKLLRLTALAYKPMTKEEWKSVQDHRHATAPFLGGLFDHPQTAS